jgi:hypothetical protein
MPPQPVEAEASNYPPRLSSSCRPLACASPASSLSPPFSVSLFFLAWCALLLVWLAVGSFLRVSCSLRHRLRLRTRTVRSLAARPPCHLSLSLCVCPGSARVLFSLFLLALCRRSFCLFFCAAPPSVCSSVPPRSCAVASVFAGAPLLPRRRVAPNAGPGTAGTHPRAPRIHDSTPFRIVLRCCAFSAFCRPPPHMSSHASRHDAMRTHAAAHPYYERPVARHMIFCAFIAAMT